MDGNDDNNSAAKKEYRRDMEKYMNRWYGLMHPLYLKLSSVLISLSVATIGFAVSYLLEDGYHSGKYETCLALSGLLFQVLGLLSLLFSGFCGLTHLVNNLTFIQCNAEYFAARFVGEEEKASECESSKLNWWSWQINSFGFGIVFLIVWVAIDFFAVG